MLQANLFPSTKILGIKNKCGSNPQRILLYFAHPTSLLHDSARRAEIPFPGERTLDCAITPTAFTPTAFTPTARPNRGGNAAISLGFSAVRLLDSAPIFLVVKVFKPRQPLASFFFSFNQFIIIYSLLQYS